MQTPPACPTCPPPPSPRARARARDGSENQRPWPADKVERWPRSATAPASIPPAAGSALPDRRRPLVMCRLCEKSASALFHSARHPASRYVPVIPAGTTLILDGVCPHNGPAPIFNASWDLSGALSLLYGHYGIEANIVTQWMTVEQNGLTVPTNAGPVIYPFGRLYVYHLGRKTVYCTT